MRVVKIAFRKTVCAAYMDVLTMLSQRNFATDAFMENQKISYKNICCVNPVAFK